VIDGDQVLREIIEAHGGADLWSGLEAVEAEVSAWGLLFAVKRRPVLRRVRVRAAAHDPRFDFLDFPALGQMAQLHGNDEVRVVRTDGTLVARREHPRAAMGGLWRHICWDALDFVYFGGYALWNYLLTPFLLLREGVRCEIVPSTGDVPMGWTTLRVHFPTHLPTHCPTQTFYFDALRRLRRLDYTAEVVGRWARAAHFCEEYRDFGGLKAPTRRRVLPRFGRAKPLPGPILVGVDLHDLRPVPRS